MIEIGSGNCIVSSAKASHFFGYPSVLQRSNLNYRSEDIERNKKRQ